MTTDELFQDLKQFITATVSQQTATLRQDIAEMQQDIAALREGLSIVDAKIDELSDSVAEALNDTHKATDEQFQNHERRIRRLEQQLAH